MGQVDVFFFVLAVALQAEKTRERVDVWQDDATIYEELSPNKLST